jgi:hypothetical protein
LANPSSFTGAWPASSHGSGFAFGLSGDRPMLINYGRTLMPVVYRYSEGNWYFDLDGFAPFNPNHYKVSNFGLPSDVPQIVRLDGRDMVAVLRGSTGLIDTDNNTYNPNMMLTVSAGWSPAIPATVSWVVSSPASFSGSWGSFSFGLPGDVPLLVQLSAGGPKLPVVFRPQEGNWYLDSCGYQACGASLIQFGQPGDEPRIVWWNGGDHLCVIRNGQHLIDTDNTSYHVTNLFVF